MRLPDSVLLQQLGVAGRQIRHARAGSQVAGLLAGANCVGKPTRLGVGRGQSAQKHGLLEVRDLAGSLSQRHGGSTVAQGCVRMGGQQPRQIVQDVG